MPKRGKGNNRVWNKEDNRGPRDSRHDAGGKYYYEHDQRGADFTRRVSFKAGTSNRVGKGKQGRADWEAIQARLGVIGDVDMDLTSNPGFSNNVSGKRYNPYVGGTRRGNRGRGGGRGLNNSPTPENLRMKKIVDGPHTAWYKITIPHGSKYEKNYVITALQEQIAPIPLVYFAYKDFVSESSFFVENAQLAEKLLNVDRRITTPEQYKLLVRVRPGFPAVDINESYKSTVKLALSRRFNATNKALDLERFHMDPSFLESGVIAALFRPTLMTVVLDIIAENIPELVALNLGQNRLQTIEHLNELAKKLPNLTILHMGQNKIREMRQLDCLKNLKLVDLVLEGNPLCDSARFKDRPVYVSEVIKKFPKLRKLDGVDLPPPILFDDEDEVTQIPPYNASFIVDPQGRDFLRQFLEQYFRIYDDDNRSSLVDAYHESAMFSLTSAYLLGVNRDTRLEVYLNLSRNLKRFEDSTRRSKVLSQGKVMIVNFLGDLPKTTHDAQSFAVDMPIYSPQLIQVNVNGIFRERETPGKPLRSFSRVFMIVPFGSGFCIINETMFVTNVTPVQEKSAFKLTPLLAVNTSLPTPAAPASEQLRSQMIHALREHSRMNVMWATKCLAETNWNYDLAVVAFNELNKVNQIPAEAFLP